MSAQPQTSVNPMQAVLAARAAQQQRSQPQSLLPSLVASITPIKPASQPEILAPSASSPTAAWADSLTRAATSHRNSMVEIAYFGRLLREADDWANCGFRDEDHFRQHLGFPESTWSNYMQLGERLRMLKLDEMKELTHSAAKLLTQIHPKIWEEYSWIDEARLLPTRDFQSLVVARNSQVSPTALAEPRSNVTVQVPMSQRKGIESRLEKLRRMNHLPTAAATLNAALTAAESQPELAVQVAAMETQLAELSRLWQPDAPWSQNLRESDLELKERFDGKSAPTNLSEAAILSQRLTRRLLKSLEAIHAVLPKEA